MSDYSKLSYLTGPTSEWNVYSTLQHEIKQRALQDSDKEAYVIYDTAYDRTSITFGELYSRSSKFANALQSLNVSKGDLIAFCPRPSLEGIVSYFGIILAGAVPVYTYVVMGNFSDLLDVMGLSVAIIVDNSNEDLLAVISSAVSNKSGQSMMTQAIVIGDSRNVENLLSFDTMMAESSSTSEAPEVYVDPDDTAVIMRSSGTTGTPKLIEYSHTTVLHMFKRYWIASPITPADKRLTTLPFFWTVGSPIFEMLRGSSLVSLSAINVSDLTKLFETIKTECCTWLSTNSVVLNYILKQGLVMNIPETIRIITISGSPIDGKFTALLDKVKYITYAYGCTEMGFLADGVVTAGDVIKNSACGTPTPDVEIKVTNKNSEIVERGTPGRVYTRTPYGFSCYYGNDDLTYKSRTLSGWYDTSDNGYITEDGQLFVLGRDGDAITRGSVTTHCSEIEQVVKALHLPQIEDAVFVPIPDDIFGENNCVCVILAPGYDVTEQYIKQQINSRIYKPEYQAQRVVFIDSYPTTATGKLDRKSTLASALKILTQVTHRQ